MSLCKGFTQGGSNADIVLADSFLKNITEGIDWNKGYEAVVSDAEGILDFLIKTNEANKYHRRAGELGD